MLFTGLGVPELAHFLRRNSPQFIAKNICMKMGLAKVFAATLTPPPAPEVPVPFRLFMTVCCGNGWLLGPGGSRCRGAGRANEFMRVNEPTSHSDPRSDADQSRQGRPRNTIKCGWFSGKCEPEVKWPPDVGLRGPLQNAAELLAGLLWGTR